MQRRLRSRWFKPFKPFKSIPDIYNVLNDWNILNDLNPRIAAIFRTLYLCGEISIATDPYPICRKNFR